MIDNQYERIFLIIIGLLVFQPWTTMTCSAQIPENEESCVEKAIQRTIAIKSLPEKKYLHTLDGQDVLIVTFIKTCRHMFPYCGFFAKFYYWESETKTITSPGANGPMQHQIRCYYSSLSRYCPNRHDPLKTHGDVAEFYDGNGVFMGLAVYMGNGQYCALPYCNYQK